MKKIFKSEAENTNVSTASGMKNANKKPLSNGKNPKTPKNPRKVGKKDVAVDVDVNGKLSSYSTKLKNMPKVFVDSLGIYQKPHKKSQLATYYRMLDMVTLAILTVMSSALPNYHFIYRGSVFFATLMSLIVAMAGIGKNALEAVFDMIKPIHLQYRDKFQKKMDAHKEQQRRIQFMSNAEKKKLSEDILEKPVQSFFRIPVDSTLAALLKALCTNCGMGAMLDTEIDTLVNALKSELADYSVILRKNFSHESHSYYRKSDDEYVEIPELKFALLLTGTLPQMVNLISEVLSGLYSRFCLYWNLSKTEWIDETVHDEEAITPKEFYLKIGYKLLTLFNVLKRKEKGVRFSLTEKQLDRFNKNFAKIHLNYTSMDGEDMHASVVRMGVIFHRIAMVFSISRLLDLTEEEMSKKLDENIICNDDDFNNSMIIVQVLMEHSSAYFEHITNIKDDVEPDVTDIDYDDGREDVNEAIKAIPFNRKLTTNDILDIFVGKGVPRSTASKKIRKLCKIFILTKVEHGVYMRTNPEEYLLKNEEAKKAKRAAKKVKQATKKALKAK